MTAGRMGCDNVNCGELYGECFRDDCPRRAEAEESEDWNWTCDDPTCGWCNWNTEEEDDDG